MKKRIIKATLKNKEYQNKMREQKCAHLKELAFENKEIMDMYSEYTTFVFDYYKTGNEESSLKANICYDEYIKIAKSKGFNPKDFEYKTLCKKCNDTGLTEKGICECTWNDYIKRLSNECEINIRAPFTYKDCNFDLIKNEDQKSNMIKLYNIAKAYCEKYPLIKTNNLVLSGGVGTGKTCLASAMANDFVSRGNTALMMSAYEFNSTMLKCHTSKVELKNNILHDIITCDLLVIDDLGTEPMLKNVTCEYLLIVLSERLNKNLATVITTNLTPTQILDKYGERIFSRLSDKVHSKFYSIKGNDLRH